ncbi:MAG TPA: TetR/AcrR family transcriptional regulator C-terminal ligand-binding domain-containing protein [Dongiaceae bacterium]|nr:TetR/AcrR family transcriptional regulator C-terminal ligand-binding domain-containing protein [Dongiaceae bacterium]
MRTLLDSGALGRGQARGDLLADGDLDLLLDVIYGPLWYRLQRRHAPLDADLSEQLLGALVLLAPDSAGTIE